MPSPLTIHTAGPDDAPVVILLHGLSDSGSNWPDLMDRWRHEWRILAPDMRAHGTSPRFAPEEMGSTAEIMLADVVALIDAQPERVALLGHSMGGALALRAAVARPEKVWALVLEDPAHASGGPSPADVGVGFGTFVAGVTARVRRGELDQLIAEGTWSAEETREWALSKPQVQTEYLSDGLHLGAQSWDELVAALTVPTLLVVPDRDSVGPSEPPPSDAVTQVVIADAGHCVRRDQPEAYCDAVETFLAAHRG